MKLAALCTIAIPLFTAASASAASVELHVRPAYGSAGSDSPVIYKQEGLIPIADSGIGTIYKGAESPYGGGFILDGGAGMLVLPFLSVGLTGGFRMASATSPTGDQTDVSRSAYRIGLYTRGYIPFAEKFLGGFDPWLSLGVGYVNDAQEYKRTFSLMSPTGPVQVPITYTLTHHGIGIPIGLGADYRVLPILAIGASLQYEVVRPVVGCAKTSGGPNVIGSTFCSNDDANKRVTTAEGYGVWSVGLDVRFVL